MARKSLWQEVYAEKNNLVSGISRWYNRLVEMRVPEDERGLQPIISTSDQLKNSFRASIVPAQKINNLNSSSTLLTLLQVRPRRICETFNCNTSI